MGDARLPHSAIGAAENLAVDRNVAACGLQEAHDQIQQCAFSATCLTYDSHPASTWDLQAYLADNIWALVPIAEAEVAQLDATRQTRVVDRLLGFQISGRNGLIQKRKDIGQNVPAAS